MIHKRTLQSLEFNRVTEVLASFCQSQSGAAMASGLLPFKTEEEVLEAQKLYEESSRWAGSPETLRLTGQRTWRFPGFFRSAEPRGQKGGQSCQLRHRGLLGSARRTHDGKGAQGQHLHPHG